MGQGVRREAVVRCKVGKVRVRQRVQAVAYGGVKMYKGKGRRWQCGRVVRMVNRKNVPNPCVKPASSRRNTPKMPAPEGVQVSRCRHVGR